MTETGTDTTAGERLLLFRLGGRIYGTSLETVREIVPWRQATRLPGAPSYVAGLINLRGTIITVADLGVRLGLEPEARNDSSIVLVQVDAKTVGFIVDEVRDVRALSADRIEQPKAGMAGLGEGARAAIRGMGHLDDEVVILVDLAVLARQILT